MEVQLKGGKNPPRNEPCPCGSGLKAKWCHSDPIKQMLCTRKANEHMASLVRQEQKKRGLVSYNWKCNSCMEDFDKPNRGAVTPHYPICPKCGSTDIEENKNKGVKDGKSKENKI